MKKLYPILAILAIVLGMNLTFTSCDDTYSPPGVLYDPDLVGRWKLVSVDGNPVYGYDTNYLELSSSGSGMYYEYVNGRPYSMELYYNVDFNSTIYITYSDGAHVAADYWFNSNATRLYLQWYDSYGMRTYCYAYVGYIDWTAPPMHAPGEKASETGTGIVRPGGQQTPQSMSK